MRLSSLRVTSLPGLENPFTVDFQPGVNLLVGPNGSGKSSLTRAVFHLLWPSLGEIKPFVVTAGFLHSDKMWQVTALDSSTITWRRDGDQVRPPGLPEMHVAPSYRLGLLDITPVDIGEDDRLLARRIRREMDGGYDLGQTEEALFSVAPHMGRTERKKLAAAVAEVRTIKNRYANLARRERTLGGLEKELDQARQAGQRAALLKALVELRSRQTELADVKQQLGELPAGVAAVSADDPTELARWRKQERDAAHALAERRKHLAELVNRQAELAWPESGEFSLELLDRQVARLGNLWEKRNDARIKLEGHRRGAGQAPDQVGAVEPQTYNRLLALHSDLLALDTRIAFWKDQQTTVRPAGSPWPGRLLLFAGLAALLGGGALVWSAGRQGLFHLPGLLSLLAGSLVTGWAAHLLGGRKTGQGPTPTARLAELTREREDLLGDMKKLAEEFQLDLDNPNLIHDQKQLGLRLAAQQDMLVAQGELDQLECDCASGLQEINAHLTLVGAGPVGNQLEAAQALENLIRRARELESLNRDIKSVRVEEQAAAGQLEQAAGLVADIHRKLGLNAVPDPDAEVARLAGLKPLCLQLRETATRTEGAIRELERTIADQSGLLDLEEAKTQPTDVLNLRAEKDRELAEQVDDLHAEVANLKSEIKAARGSSSLEQAADHEDRCRQDLAEKRDEARRAALGKLLLGQVRRQSESRSRPPVLAQAMKLFSEFTRQRYELQVSGGQAEDQGRFRARDSETGLDLELSQLSDGTRAQLLLAVRLGFIFQSESEARPPLFLDDSLTSSDPERFAAVAASLGQLARRQERQIIYLTANPVDALAWNRALEQAGLAPAHSIDLAQARGMAGRAPQASLELPEIPDYPSFSGMTAPEYGALLQVPRLDPWAPANRAHLFYLLTDELDLLRNLLTAGTPTVGRWLQGRTRHQEGGIVSHAQAGQLDIRCEIWQATQAAWQVGRGRPVTMADLEASGQVTPTMRDAVAALLTQCGQNAALFMAALRGGQVKRFQEAKKDQLQEYLELEGFLDSRPVLDDDAMVQQAVGELSHRVAAGAVSPPEIRSLVLTLAASLSTPADSVP